MFEADKKSERPTYEYNKLLVPFIWWSVTNKWIHWNTKIRKSTDACKLISKILCDIEFSLYLALFKIFLLQGTISGEVHAPSKLTLLLGKDPLIKGSVTSQSYLLLFTMDWNGISCRLSDLLLQTPFFTMSFISLNRFWQVTQGSYNSTRDDYDFLQKLGIRKQLFLRLALVQRDVIHEYGCLFKLIGGNIKLISFFKTRILLRVKKAYK